VPEIVVIEPADPIVTVAAVKLQLGITHALHDARITESIAAATAMIDGPNGWLGRSLGVQTLEYRDDRFPECGWFYLPCRPIRSVVSIAYDDVLGAPQTLAGDRWRLKSGAVAPARGLSWPAVECAPGSVRIRYEAGYGEDGAPEYATVPVEAIRAVTLMAGYLYGLSPDAGRLRREEVDGVGVREWDIRRDLDEKTQESVYRLLDGLRVFA
jgi:uncharacterized phiE125 gp8 family phage protein